MGGLLALAVGVELFGEGGDAGLLFGAGGGEGEFIEAAGFVVARIVAYAKRAAGSQRPDDVDLRGEHAEGVGVGQRDADELVVRSDGCVEELEDAVLGRFDGGDVAVRPAEHGAQFRARFGRTATSFRDSLRRVCWSRSGLTRSSTH